MHQAYVKIPIHSQWRHKRTAEGTEIELPTEELWPTSIQNVTVGNITCLWQRYKHGEGLEVCSNTWLVQSQSSVMNTTRIIVLFQPIPVAERPKARLEAARLLGLWGVRIPPGTWRTVCCECYVLSRRCLCYGPIIRPEESYRLWCVRVWSQNLDNVEALAHWGWPTGAVEPWEEKLMYITIDLYKWCWRLRVHWNILRLHFILPTKTKTRKSNLLLQTSKTFPHVAKLIRLMQMKSRLISPFDVVYTVSHLTIYIYIYIYTHTHTRPRCPKLLWLDFIFH